MIIIHKKRLVFSLFIITFLLFIICIVTCCKENVVQTMAIPVSNKVVILDARTWASR